MIAARGASGLRSGAARTLAFPEPPGLNSDLHPLALWCARMISTHSHFVLFKVSFSPWRLQNRYYPPIRSCITHFERVSLSERKRFEGLYTEAEHLGWKTDGTEGGVDDMSTQSEPVEATPSGGILTPRAILRILWRRLWVIVLVTLLFMGANFGLAMTQTPSYESAMRVLIVQESSEASISNLSGTVDGLQQLTTTLAEAAADRPVANAASEELNGRVSPEQILANLSVAQVGETQFIEITYESSDPGLAQQVTAAVGESFTEQIAEISPSVGNVTASAWSPASEASAATVADPLVGALMAQLLGMTLGVALAFLLEYLDDRWRSTDELEQASGVPNLGAVPGLRKTASRGKLTTRGRRRGSYV